MSEIQNRAMRVLRRVERPEQLSDLSVRREQFLTTALRLYLAMGGSEASVDGVLRTQKQALPFTVDKEAGQLILELAAICSLHDMDMIQAAGNQLELLSRNSKHL